MGFISPISAESGIAAEFLHSDKGGGGAFTSGRPRRKLSWQAAVQKGTGKCESKSVAFKAFKRMVLPRTSTEPSSLMATPLGAKGIPAILA